MVNIGGRGSKVLGPAGICDDGKDQGEHHREDCDDYQANNSYAQPSSRLVMGSADDIVVPIMPANRKILLSL